MANGPRSIYSRRQRMAPGQYDTSLADFLSKLPDYYAQLEGVKLARDKQELAETRYREEKDLEQTRYDEKKKKEDYERALEATKDYDFKAKSQTAKTFNQDKDAELFNRLADDQNTNMVETRNIVSQVMNLPRDATYHDWDAINISPEQINILKERDPFAYDNLLKAKNKYDEQRKTGFREMSIEDKSALQRAERNLEKVQRELIDVAQRTPTINTDNKTYQDILKALRATGFNPDSEMTQLMGQLDMFQGNIDDIYNKYRVTAPQPPNNTSKSDMETVLKFNPLEYGPPLPNPAINDFTFETPGDAANNNELLIAQYTMATEPEDSDEYIEAEERLKSFASLKDTDIGTPKPEMGIIKGLRERMSVAGLEREQEGEGGPARFGISPEARAFKLPPKKDMTPEYFERTASQAEEAIARSGAEKSLQVGGLQNPVYTQQYYGNNIDVAIAAENAKLSNRDKIVNEIKLAVKAMPKTKKYQKILTRLNRLLKNNPVGERYIRSGGGTRLTLIKKGLDKIDFEDQQIFADFQNQQDRNVGSRPGLLDRLMNVINTEQAFATQP